LASAQGFSAGSDYSGEEFQNYVPYKPKMPPKKEVTQPVQKIPPTKEQTKDEIKPLKEWTPKELGQLWEKGRDKAVMDPSDANVREYMYTQDIILDIATRYSEKQMEIVKNDPFLNQSNRISISNSGEVDAKRLQDKAINVAVDEMAKKGGLLVFVESTCTFCSHQLPILEGLKNSLNPYHPMEYLVISIDAKGPNGWKNFVPDNGLFKRLNLTITPSIVYVPNPSPYKDGRDNNKYIVVSQGEIEHLDALTRRIAEVGIKAHIVSKETMKDFDIWNRGVATSKDLGDLKLNSKTLHNIPTQVQEIKRNSF
jgi:conjugal transfer pilus assembly protein TraF